MTCFELFLHLAIMYWVVLVRCPQEMLPSLSTDSLNNNKERGKLISTKIHSIRWILSPTSPPMLTSDNLNPSAQPIKDQMPEIGKSLPGNKNLNQSPGYDKILFEN